MQQEYESDVSRYIKFSFFVGILTFVLLILYRPSRSAQQYYESLPAQYP